MTDAAAGPVLFWFRRDLRLADQPGLTEAIRTGRSVIPVHILDETPGPSRPGAASRWWLHHSLAALARDLAALAGRPVLVHRRGPALAVLRALAAETGAAAVYWSRAYEPDSIARDTGIKAALAAAGLEVRSVPGSLLFEPWTVTTAQGGPYQVFTPFWRACLTREVGPALPRPDRLTVPATLPAGLDLSSLELLPAIDWAAGLRRAWVPGEAGAENRLAAFIADTASSYAARRDRPDLAGTSRLSPHLHFGEISPRRVWQAIRDATGPAGEPFLRQLVWREFSHHLLYHVPALPDRPLKPAFESFPWADDTAGLAAWQAGQTGYPIVDAGMRELWSTGWMHNRVRMIVASFLVKDLLLPWQAGAAWFWDTLVDADLANNAASWQWVAGCGADAAPYFRIFNPMLQGAKFDPEGAYVRHWIPALGRLPTAHLQAPWAAPADVLRAAGVTLGQDYPPPLVDHAGARARALATLAGITRPVTA